MSKAFLRKTRETRVRGGHPWIYASEIERVDDGAENGGIISTYTAAKTRSWAKVFSTPILKSPFAF